MAGLTPVKETAIDRQRNAQRRERICMGRKLYRGAWRDLLMELSQFAYPAIKRHSGSIEALMAKVNGYRLAVMTHTKFMALREPTVSIPKGFDVQRQRWNEIARDCLFAQRVFESILKEYREAEAWWRLTARSGRACLSVADSLQVFPLGDFGHDDQPRAVDLRWVITRRDSRDQEMHYLRVERHTPGLIENFAYKVSSRFACAIPDKAAPIDLRAILGDEAPQPAQTTGVDRPLLFRAALCVVDDETQMLIEKEDFDIIDANAKALSQLLMNQDRHGSPILRLASEGQLEKDGTFDASKRARLAQQGEIEYINWDGKLVETMDAFARILRYFFIQLEMSPELIGLKEGAAADAYEKLMLQAVVTTSRAHLTKQTNEPVLDRVVTTACEFDAHLNPVGYPTGAVSVTLHPGLPRTPDEENRSLAEMRLNGQISQESMLRQIYGDEQALEELARIEAEEQKRTQALGFGSTFGGGLGAPAQPSPDEPIADPNADPTDPEADAA